MQMTKYSGQPRTHNSELQLFTPVIISSNHSLSLRIKQNNNSSSKTETYGSKYGMKLRLGADAYNLVYWLFVLNL